MPNIGPIIESISRFNFLDKLKNDPDYMGDDMWPDVADLINKEKHLDKPCFNKKAGNIPAFSFLKKYITIYF